MVYGRWYELDGFVMRKRDRHCMVKKMSTVEEYVLSDHKPKVMTVRVNGKRWRAQGGRVERVPKIRWEVLKSEEKMVEYERKTREGLNEENGREDEEGEWKKMTKVMMKAAKEVCGEERKGVAKPMDSGT